MNKTSINSIIEDDPPMTKTEINRANFISHVRKIAAIMKKVQRKKNKYHMTR